MGPADRSLAPGGLLPMPSSPGCAARAVRSRGPAGRAAHGLDYTPFWVNRVYAGRGQSRIFVGCPAIRVFFNIYPPTRNSLRCRSTNFDLPAKGRLGAVLAAYSLPPPRERGEGGRRSRSGGGMKPVGRNSEPRSAAVASSRSCGGLRLRADPTYALGSPICTASQTVGAFAAVQVTRWRLWAGRKT